MNDTPAKPLVTCLPSGNGKMYVDLYDRLGGAMFRAARRMVGNSTDAEDAVHDVFIELVRSRERLETVIDVDAYVFTMLRHQLYRRIRVLKREQKQLRPLPPAIAAPPLTTSDDELLLAMQSLPVEQRELIALKIDGGLTFAQIAVLLDISPNTAASRYRYALEKLRRQLEADP